jgi:hypothetical protein
VTVCDQKSGMWRKVENFEYREKQTLSDLDTYLNHTTIGMQKVTSEVLLGTMLLPKGAAGVAGPPTRPHVPATASVGYPAFCGQGPIRT